MGLDDMGNYWISWETRSTRQKRDCLQFISGGEGGGRKGGEQATPGERRIESAERGGIICGQELDSPEDRKE